MKRILVVDDDTAIAETLEILLAEEGYRVVLAWNGAKALERLADEDFDLVLLDLMMPVLDGLSTLEKLRVELRSSVPVLLMSAAAPRSFDERVDELGSAELISKPFDVGTLLEKVAAVTGG